MREQIWVLFFSIFLFMSPALSSASSASGTANNTDPLQLAVQQRIKEKIGVCNGAPVFDNQELERNRRETCNKRIQQESYAEVSAEQIVGMRRHICKGQSPEACSVGAPAGVSQYAMLCKSICTSALPAVWHSRLSRCDAAQACGQDPSALQRQTAIAGCWTGARKVGADKLVTLPQRVVRLMASVNAAIPNALQSAGQGLIGVGAAVSESARDLATLGAYEASLRRLGQEVNTISQTGSNLSAAVKETVEVVEREARVYMLCLQPEDQIKLACALGADLGVRAVEGWALGLGGVRLARWASDALFTKTASGVSVADDIVAQLGKVADDAAPPGAMPASQAATAATSAAGPAVDAALPSWNALPKALTTPLPTPFTEAVVSHPIAQQLREKYGTGSGLGIRIHEYRLEVEGGAKVPLNGEQTQAVFLKKILKEILPDATFIEGTQTATPSFLRRTIEMQVRDPAEIGRRLDWKTVGVEDGTIHMAALKPANPGPAAVGQADLRTAMGLPRDAKIASIYASFYTEAEQVAAMASKVLNQSEGSITILSHASNDGAERLIHHFEHYKKVVVVRSENVGKVRFDPNQRYVIINQTRNVMPYIHQASDYTVVMGASNIYESLNMGVPTFFLRNAANGYHETVWNQITDIGMRTGGGRYYETASDITKAVRAGDLPRPQRPSYTVRDGTGASALDRLMTNISNVVLEGAK